MLVAILTTAPTGCTTAEPQASATKQIEIFLDGKEPAQPYKVIGSLTDDSRLEEHPAIEAKKVKKARQMGGDALVFEPKVETGIDVGPFAWGAKKSYLYKAKVIKYE